jgi:hypothetical protein
MIKKKLGEVSKISLYLLVFLLPLFWLPFSFETWELNKLYLFFFLTLISFLFWLAKMIVVDKKIRFYRTPLDVLVLSFLIIVTLSTIFSIDKNTSLFGSYGRFFNGLVATWIFALFYFLITNSSSFGAKPSTLTKLFLISVFLVVLMSYFSIFGIWQKLSSSLPSFMLLPEFNLISSSLEGLAIFLSVAIILLIGLIVAERKGQKRTGGKNQLFYYLLLTLSSLLLLIIDFGSAWIVILITSLSLLIFALLTRIFKK